MKKLFILVTFIITILILPSFVFANTMQCGPGNDIVQDKYSIGGGSSVSDLFELCGKPFYREGNKWFYNIGAGRFIRIVIIRGNQVEQILESDRRAETDPPKPKITQVAYRSAIRVIDGDTILLDGDERVRLIGVDTPETVHPNKPVEYFGKEASEFTRKMVEGKQVRLEYDWERKDKYDRTLAYVYLEDGTFLNAEIIRQGYGFAYTKFPFKYLEQFRQYEREAKENKRGLWK